MFQRAGQACCLSVSTRWLFDNGETEERVAASRRVSWHNTGSKLADMLLPVLMLLEMLLLTMMLLLLLLLLTMMLAEQLL